MAALKYKVIKSKKQYKEYCNALLHLLESNSRSREVNDEIELLTVLIDKWDEEHNSFTAMDPIQLLRALMEEHGLKPKDLVPILGTSKGLISDILNYKKGLSKDVIRKLSEHFKMSQEAFNRPYKLVSKINSRLRNASVMNNRKELAV